MNLVTQPFGGNSCSYRLVFQLHTHRTCSFVILTMDYWLGNHEPWSFQMNLWDIPMLIFTNCWAVGGSAVFTSRILTSYFQTYFARDCLTALAFFKWRSWSSRKRHIFYCIFGYFLKISWPTLIVRLWLDPCWTFYQNSSLSINVNNFSLKSGVSYR